MSYFAMTCLQQKNSKSPNFFYFTSPKYFLRKKVLEKFHCIFFSEFFRILVGFMFQKGATEIEPQKCKICPTSAVLFCVIKSREHLSKFRKIK